MNKILFLIIIMPALCLAQEILPRFSHDTLYSTTGYNLYVGQTIHLLHGTGKDKFRFVKIFNSGKNFNNAHITIMEIKEYTASSLERSYLTFIGMTTFRDGYKTHIQFQVNFESALRPLANMPAEIELPAPYQLPEAKTSVTDEIKKLKGLLDDGTITQEEFDA